MNERWLSSRECNIQVSYEINTHNTELTYIQAPAFLFTVKKQQILPDKIYNSSALSLHTVVSSDSFGAAEWWKTTSCGL